MLYEPNENEDDDPIHHQNDDHKTDAFFDIKYVNNKTFRFIIENYNCLQ